MASTRSEYWLVPEGRTYTIYSRRGVELDGIETIGSAQAHLDEMVGVSEDSEADDEAPRSAIADFLHALDRGDFGDLRIGPSWDRAESAFISALRKHAKPASGSSLIASASSRPSARVASESGGQSP